MAFYPQMLYPGHAVSWEGCNGNLAALVVSATPSLVKISTFNLAKTLLDLNLRVWDLDNGTYTIVEGTDVLGQGHIDVETTRRTLPLWRGANIPSQSAAAKDHRHRSQAGEEGCGRLAKSPIWRPGNYL